jgi:hypothetical protein
MKKLLIIAAFVFAVSLTASFGAGQIRISVWPTDDRRDQQWTESNRSHERAMMQRERFQREQWQRAQWQQDERYRHGRHMRSHDYNFWVSLHSRDWDNRR